MLLKVTSLLERYAISLTLLVLMLISSFCWAQLYAVHSSSTSAIPPVGVEEVVEGESTEVKSNILIVVGVVMVYLEHFKRD